MRMGSAMISMRVPYVEKRVRYAETGNPRVIDPSQVDHILVCGVRVELPD